MSYVSRPVLWTWIVLVAATLASWWLGTDHGLSGEAATISILVVAFVKVRLVTGTFMEVRSAPRALAIGIDLYLVAVLAALVLLYLEA